MKTVSINIVQKCEMSNKEWFIELVRDLSPDDFKLFCKEIMHLNEHYAHTVGAYATDQLPVYLANNNVMWEIEPIDFNSEVNFKQIS